MYHARNHSMKLTMSSLLGPQWTAEELRAFYVLVKRQGQRQRKVFVEGRHMTQHPLLPPLPGRTPAMLRALYDMHRGYLSLAEASAEGFCAIMMDHYKNNPPAVSAEEDHAMTIGLSTMEEDATGEKVLSSVIPATKIEHQAAYNQSLKRNEHPTKTESKTKKRRTLDLILSRESATPEDFTTLDGQAADGLQRLAKGGRRQHRLVWSAKIDRRWLTDSNASALSAKKFDLPWYYWFESVFDAEFFNENQFMQSLHQMDLGKVRTILQRYTEQEHELTISATTITLRLPKQPDRSGLRSVRPWAALDGSVDSSWRGRKSNWKCFAA